MNRSTAIAITVFAGASLAVALACGPWFPRRMLLDPTAVLESPPADLFEELERLPNKPPIPVEMGLRSAPPERPRLGGGVKPRVILERDVDEFREVMLKRDLPPAELDALVDAYHHWRLAMMPKPRRGPWPQAEPVAPETVAGFPAQFRLYGEGALLYRAGQFDDAILKWKQVLELPEEERRERSTWAAWMIARTERDRAGFMVGSPWYRKVGALAAAGFADTLDLAPSATGWLAFEALRAGRLADALTLYYHQALAGDPTAPQSIAITVGGLLDAGDEAMQGVAADPTLRGVVTVQLLRSITGARRLPNWQPAGDAARISGQWQLAMEEVGVSDAVEAEQLAWLAYADGDARLAERWLELAPDDSAVALWLRGKLALRAGRERQAAAYFKRAFAHFPLGLEVPDHPGAEPAQHPYQSHRFHSDFGIVSLSRTDYLQALTAFMKSGDMDDAAYIAEAVLSAEELLVYVRDRHPQASAPRNEQRWIPSKNDWLRWLLARRLAREQFYKNAREFYPEEWAPVFDEFVTAWRAGVDKNNPGEERAALLWKAAQIQRRYGMELFGYELWPDAFSWGGNFQMPTDAEVRFPGRFGTAEDGIVRPWRPAESSFVLAPSAGELWRVKRYFPEITKRFHYRYAAAELAWQAAALMPGDSEDTARILGIAGGWLKDRDPGAADRFYKAMVRRNPNTELGRQADQKRWFPPIDWSFRLAGAPRLR